MQRETTKLRVVEQPSQLSFIPERTFVSRPVDVQHVALLKNHRAAIEYACLLADVEPKQVYTLLNYDKTKWSRICNGERALPSGDIKKLNAVLGNKAYLLYVNHDCGVDISTIRDLGDDKDRVIAEQAQEIADLRRAMRLQAEASAEALAQRRAGR